MEIIAIVGPILAIIGTIALTIYVIKRILNK